MRIPCLILVLGVVSAVSSAVAEGIRTVRVGYYSQPGMMNGASEGAVKSGYAYEYMQEVAIHAGWKYEYIYGTFEELYAGLRRGEIDLMPYVNFTKARKREVLFPERNMGRDRIYLAAKSTMPPDGGLAGLKGRKVGTGRRTYNHIRFSELVEKQGIDCEIVEFDTPEERWAALWNCEIDYSIEMSSMQQTGIMHPVYEFDWDNPYYLAVSPERKDILAELDQAQQQIDKTNPGFRDALRIKHFRGAALSRNLPEEALEWLDRHPVIRIATYDHQEPYFIRRADGSVSGIEPDFVQEMFSQMGILNRVEWKTFPGRSLALDALRAGEVDAILPYYCSYADAENDGVIISGPVFSVHFGVLYRGEYDERTMAVVSSPGPRLGARYTRDNFPQSRCVPALTGYLCVEMLLAGRVNGVVMNYAQLSRIAAENSADLKLKLLNSLCPVALATSRENSALIGIVNKAAPLVSQACFNSIDGRYVACVATPANANRVLPRALRYMHVSALAISLLVIMWLVLRLRAAGRRFRELTARTEQDKVRRPRRLSGLRVLLVDDNEINLEVSGHLLAVNGADVETANSGMKAVEMVRGDRYDLILMDVLMPGMNGYDATRKIRELDDKVPIVALSANANAEDRAASLAAGMNEHLGKPLTERQLFECLGKVLGRGSEE